MEKPTESRAIPLLGRRDEVEALVRAMQAGQSRLIAEALSRYSAPYVLVQCPLKTREHTCLKPLRQAEAAALFEAAVAAHKLDSLDLDDFRTKMLRSVFAMCRLATRPEYRVGRRTRFLPLRMDVLPAFV